MQVGVAGGHTPAGGAHQEALLDEERLDDILERAALLADRGRQAVDADRTAVEPLDDGGQELAVERVEALLVHLAAYPAPRPPTASAMCPSARTWA